MLKKRRRAICAITRISAVVRKSGFLVDELNFSTVCGVDLPATVLQKNVNFMQAELAVGGLWW